MPSSDMTGHSSEGLKVEFTDCVLLAMEGRGGVGLGWAEWRGGGRRGRSDQRQGEGGCRGPSDQRREVVDAAAGVASDGGALGTEER